MGGNARENATNCSTLATAQRTTKIFTVGGLQGKALQRALARLIFLADLKWVGFVLQIILEFARAGTATGMALSNGAPAVRDFACDWVLVYRAEGSSGLTA